MPAQVHVAAVPLQGMVAPPGYDMIRKVTGEGTTEGHRPTVTFRVILTVERRSVDKRGTLAALRTCSWWNPSGGDNLGGGGNWQRRK
jgi:hypothetical protein